MYSTSQNRNSMAYLFFVCFQLERGFEQKITQTFLLGLYGSQLKNNEFYIKFRWTLLFNQPLYIIIKHLYFVVTKVFVVFIYATSPVIKHMISVIKQLSRTSMQINHWIFIDVLIFKYDFLLFMLISFKISCKKYRNYRFIILSC